MNLILFFHLFFCFQQNLILSETDFTIQKVKVKTIVSHGGVIWGFDFPNEKQIIYTVRSGEIILYDRVQKRKIRLAPVPQTQERGQGGMLDIYLHPDFEKNKLLFITYSKKIGRHYTTALSRAYLMNNRLTNLKEIFVAQALNHTNIHFGSRVRIGKDGFIYLTIGDRGDRHKAQSLKFHHGKVLRLDLNGTAATGNPFLNRKGALPEIYSLGHRNPQGLTINLKNGEVWEQEHGPRGGDEINLIEAGKNYGWPIITHGREYWGPSIGEGTSRPGMEQPVKYYTPSIAPSGLSLHLRPSQKEWEDHLFSGALKLRHLNYIQLFKKKVVQEKRLLLDLEERIRDVRSYRGNLYVSTDSGKILQMMDDL